MDVCGWLTAEEALELASLAAGKVVLEIGTYCGKSALAMAKAARKVYCLDHFRGDSRVDGAGSRDEAFRNFDGHWDKIVVLAGSQEDVLPRLDLSGFDMVFYDADHSFESTVAGVDLLERLPSGATVVFHDYRSSTPGVMQAVDLYAASTKRQMRNVDSLAIFDGEQPAGSCYSVLLGIPHNGSVMYGTARALFRASRAHDVRIQDSCGSLLASTFNQLWCTALNAYGRGEITHLAFLHSDIAPQDGWIDILLDEMDRLDADLISVVSPIKDARGLTSTGVSKPGERWHPHRRFTMTEVMELPETFTAADAGYDGDVLLVNSGCWVADLRKPVFRQTYPSGLARTHFTIRDRVVLDNGEWTSHVEPEDWYFSRELAELDAKVYATRKVRLEHYGYYGFPNYEAFGGWQHDEQTRCLWDKGQADDRGPDSRHEARY